MDEKSALQSLKNRDDIVMKKADKGSTMRIYHPISRTPDYINKTPSTGLPDHTLLVTIAVTSLYTYIPHDEGIEACREVWDSRSIQIPSIESLAKLLEHVLKYNNFVFNGGYYLQVNGTAMCPKMAPSNANIFMGRLEYNSSVKHIPRYIYPD
ncbi:uncharacterized protein LOC133180383 [Saccostrea echinata]|uniref:uncharacterized protein LOC133180383 n=1 Tax=Saccostrea echinata TaxID=191078 RepID=UPI002A82EFE2|nr:uncharacterized protein LOC133180383 [Saccostrea echinata]